MKFFSKTFLFCFFVIISLVFLDSISAAKFHRYGNASNDSVIFDFGKSHQQDIRSSDAMLLSDGNEHGIEEDGDVKIVRSGPINLTLTEGKLEFEICNCEGTSTICYESYDSAAGLCGGFSSCEFKVKSNITNWVVGATPIYKSLFPGCLQTLMKSPVAEIRSTVGVGFPSCNPKMDDNKMIKLHASINPRCHIRVKNAKLNVPIIPTTLTELPPPKLQNETSESSSFPIWGYIIIIVAIVVLIVILIIGFIAYHLYKTHQPSKCIPPNIDEIKSKPTSNANVAIVETPTNQKLAKEVEPNMNNENKSKKSQKNDKKKKTKTQEPTTTEEIPTISQQESVPSIPSKQLPPPNPAACYPEVKSVIPSSIKSAKTDSLNETLKKDKSLMMETESVKFF